MHHPVLVRFIDVRDGSCLLTMSAPTSGTLPPVPRDGEHVNLKSPTGTIRGRVERVEHTIAQSMSAYGIDIYLRVY